jgi:hypothetical protein
MKTRKVFHTLFCILFISQIVLSQNNNGPHNGRIEACGKLKVEFVVEQDSSYCIVYLLNSKLKAIDVKHYSLKVMLYFGSDGKKPVDAINKHHYFIIPIENWNSEFNKCEVEVKEKKSICNIEFKPLKNIEQPVRGRK